MDSTQDKNELIFKRSAPKSINTISISCEDLTQDPPALLNDLKTTPQGAHAVLKSLEKKIQIQDFSEKHMFFNIKSWKKKLGLENCKQT